MNLVAELRRRNVIRMAGLYLVGAWLVVQVAATLLPVFEAPAWVMKVLVALLATGLLPALVFAWVFELTPEGLKRDAEVPPERSIAPHTARRMDLLIIVVLTLALGYFAVDKFVLAPGHDPAGGAGVPRTGATTPLPPAAMAARPDPAADASDPNSIAVLAFADLSPARDQEAFADGVAEEILHALGRVEGLRVAGRTASFYYRGRDERLSTISRELDVRYVLEGSVRRQGERVRISTQLVRGSDGSQLWSESYDGALDDVFALQERIAQSVTHRLQLALPAAGTLVDTGTRDSAAYALYLDAQAIFHRREGERYRDAIAMLERALALDPGYARALARLAMLHANLSEPTATEDYAARALAADPRLAEPHVALGLMAEAQRRYLDAHAHYQRALALAPDDAEARFRFGRMLLALGYLRQGTEWLDRALLVEPLHPNAIWRRGLRAIEVGDLPAAERAFARARELGLSWADDAEATLANARGDDAAARTAALPRLRSGGYTNCPALDASQARVLVAGLFGGSADERAAALDVVEGCLALEPQPVSGGLVMHLLWLGASERALEVYARAPTTSDVQLLNHLWRPRYAAVRALPTFPAFLRASGIAAYWNVEGPPDLCRKLDDGDYRCE